MSGLPEDTLLMAATGLEGGMVGAGSTCGIVSGSALGIALMHIDRLNHPDGQTALLEKVRRQVDWHRSRFGSTLCRERTRVDFHTFGGQFRYFTNPVRILPCFFDIGGAVSRVHAVRGDFSGEISTKPPPEATLHCATAVLSGVRERTGIGDPLLESLAFVFDGGIGLSGNLCGAAAGAVMAANLVFGINSRKLGRRAVLGKFLTGHLNLFTRKSRRMPEPFGIGRILVDDFKEAAGALECRDITGQVFDDPAGFQEHLAAPEPCQAIIDRTIAKTAQVIQEWRPFC